MKVYKVTCYHGPPMIFRDREQAQQEYQEHVAEECEEVGLEEIDMDEAALDALPEHPGW